MPSQDIKSFAIKAKKQIQIQSMCQWKNDRKMVLEGLFERMNHDRLQKRFYIGPYYISPVTRIVLKKPSGNLITYRVGLCCCSLSGQIKRKACRALCCFVCGYFFGAVTKTVGFPPLCFQLQISKPEKVSDCEDQSEGDDGNYGEEVAGAPLNFYGATPGGRLRALKKPPGRKASGLIQVRLK